VRYRQALIHKNTNNFNRLCNPRDV
jgi:hypothetical protein